MNDPEFLYNLQRIVNAPYGFLETFFLILLILWI